LLNDIAKSLSADPLLTNTNYFEVFNQLGSYAIAGAVILFVFSTKIDFFTQEKMAIKESGQ
jgi:POT family proton-dependent oligopeptide transporter